ncbi:MAG: hypothetical protein ACK5HR_04490 [Mycoplasmatales bacterium]
METFEFEISKERKLIKDMEKNPNKEFLIKELIREFTIEHEGTKFKFEIKGNYKEVIDSFYGRDLGTQFIIYEKDENGEWILLDFKVAIGYSRSVR